MPCTASAPKPASNVAQPWPGLNASGLRRSGIAYGTRTDITLPTPSSTPKIAGASPSVSGT